MKTMSCESFAEVLAAKQSTPGGGSAAAMTGALAAALGAMTTRFTRGKERYAAFEEDLARIEERLDSLRVELLELVDEDAKALAPLIEAYGIPASEVDRDQRIEQAARAALEVPRKMMGCIAEVITLTEELLEKGSKLLRSDVGCAAALAQGAMEAASFNVLVNVASLNDHEVASQLRDECLQQLDGSILRAQAIVTAVRQDYF